MDLLQEIETEHCFDFQYKISGQSNARTGLLTTPNGIIETPAFIFCGTRAVIRALPAHLLKELKTQIILSNTYHLLLRPGHELINKIGGLQKFTGWKGPMMTDSGGFQIFSLGDHRTGELAIAEVKGSNLHKKTSLLHINSDGAIFKSYYDGRKYMLTPELSMDIQCKLGADIVVVFDECIPYTTDKLYVSDSMENSHKWAKRSFKAFRKYSKKPQVLYGIIHGSTFEDLRKQSADFNNNMPYFGHAIGGSLGRDKKQMYDVVAYSIQCSRKDRPVHLLGVGCVSDIFECVRYGVDTFDCVHPTRIARHGSAFVKPQNNTDIKREHINLHNAQFKYDERPIETDCLCPTCKNYSRSYINFLLSIQDITAFTIITIHNIYFINSMMEEIRWGIKNNKFKQVESKWNIKSV